MRILISFLAELVVGALVGVLAFYGATIALAGNDPTLVDAGTIASYMFGVVAGVWIGGETIGRGGSPFLAFMGALVGAVLVRLADNPGLRDVRALEDVIAAAFQSIAILGPILATMAYNLGPKRMTGQRKRRYGGRW